MLESLCKDEHMVLTVIICNIHKGHVRENVDIAAYCVRFQTNYKLLCYFHYAIICNGDVKLISKLCGFEFKHLIHSSEITCLYKKEKGAR